MDLEILKNYKLPTAKTIKTKENIYDKAIQFLSVLPSAGQIFAYLARFSFEFSLLI